MIVRPTIFVVAFFILASGCLSFVHPWGNLHNSTANTSILSGSEMPGEIRDVLQRKCADCHSNNTHWPIYSRMAPASWLVEHDVNAGRNAMNLSIWAGMSADDRIAALARIAAEARSGEMPPKPYAMVHAAALTQTEKQEIVAWARSERTRIRKQASDQRERK